MYSEFLQFTDWQSKERAKKNEYNIWESRQRSVVRGLYQRLEEIFSISSESIYDILFFFSQLC